MSAITSIEMYNILKAKIGESEAKALTEYVETKVENRQKKKEIYWQQKKTYIKLK